MTGKEKQARMAMSDEELQTNLEQAYYSRAGVDNALSNGMLTVETADNYQWIEVEHDGVNRLCIACPAVVKNGPGDKFIARAAKD